MSEARQAPPFEMEATLPGDARADTQVTPEPDSVFPLQRLFAAGLPDEPEVAPVIGRFSILHKLGQGGMGVVYLGYDPRLDRRAAVKLVRSGGGEQGRSRMLREAQALAKLSHPNVVAIYESGEHGDDAYIAMEFVEGLTLRAWLEAEPRGVAEILEVFAAAGRGLMAAHAQGLTHRDFKPDNVMVGNDGRARVMDFGLVRTLDDAEPARASAVESAKPRAEDGLTATGTLLGTPAYMAPEQIRGEHTGPRTDQFSFCVALWEALHGCRPFAGRTLRELTANILAGRIVEPQTPAKLPSRVRAALERGMAVDVEARWPSMAELLAALDGQLPGTRRRSLMAVSLLAITTLLGALGFAWHRSAALAEAHTQQRRADADVRAARASKLLEQGEGVDALTQAIAAAGSLANESGAVPAALPTGVARALHDSMATTLSWGAVAELPGRASVAAFSPDGAWLALAQSDRKLGIDRHRIDIHAAGEHAVAVALRGHDCLIRSMDFDASGTRLLARCYEQGGSHLWDVRSGERLASFADDAVLGFAAASSMLAVRDGDDVSLVDARTGAVVSRLDGHGGPARALAFSADGSKLALAGPRDVRVWDTSRAALVSTLAHEGTLALAWFADGSGRLATVAGDRRVRVWAPESSTALVEFDSGAKPSVATEVHALAVAPDGGRVALYVDREAWLWDTQSGERVAELIDRAVNPLDNDKPWVLDVEGAPLSFSPDGSRLVMRLHDGSVRLLDGRSGAELVHTGLALSYAFSPDAETLAVGNDGVDVLELETGARVRTLPGVISNITVFSPDGRLLATRGQDSSDELCVHLWDTHERPSSVAALDLTLRSDSVLAVAPSGGRVAVADGERVDVWDVEAQRSIASFAGHVGGVRALEFSREAAGLASIDDEDTLRVWDLARGQLRGEPIAKLGLALVGRERFAYSPLSLSDDGARVAVARGKRVRVWDVASSTVLADFEGRCADRNVVDLEFAPGGGAILVHDCELRLWSVASGEPLAELDGVPTRSGLAISPDGARLATSAGMFELASGALIHTLEQRDGDAVVHGGGPAAFSPDGALLVMGGELWDGHTGALIGRLAGHEDGIVGVGFADAGARVVTASHDAIVVRAAESPFRSACRQLRPYVTAYTEVAQVCDAALAGTKVQPRIPQLAVAKPADGRWIAQSVWALALLSLMLVVGLPDRIAQACARLFGPRLREPASQLGFAGVLATLAVGLALVGDWHLGGYASLPSIAAEQLVSGFVGAGVVTLGLAWLLRTSPSRWWVWAGLASLAAAGGCLLGGAELVDAVHERSVVGAPLLEALAQPFVHVADASRFAAGTIVEHGESHRALGHRWQSLLGFTGVVFFGLFGVDRAATRILARHGARLGCGSLAERGAVPLVLALLVALGLAAAPALNALARQQELAADELALERTSDVEGCVAHAVMRAGDSGLSEGEPALASVIWRGRQPGLADRVARCR